MAEAPSTSRFSEWYSDPKNRNSLNKRRRRNYKKDPTYRERVLASSRKWRKKRAVINSKLPPKPKTHWSIGEVAAEIGCEQKTIRTLEKQGLIPGSTEEGRTHRRYTKAQIKLVAMIVDHRKAIHYRHPKYAETLKKLSKTAWEQW